MSVIEAPVRTQVEQDILKTIHRIEEYGWGQGQWPYCGVGNWKKEMPESSCVFVSYLKAAEPAFGDGSAAAFRSALGFRSLPEMFAWNDTPGRTKQEVLDRLHAALEGLR